MKRVDQYVACVRNEDRIDLEVGKLYRILPPEPLDGPEHLRVVDESGEDYLYPASWFVEVDVPAASARALRAAQRSRSGAAG